MVERSEDRWTDYIVPDSRQKKWKVITLSEDEDDGEVFDFASVNQMESSDEEDIPRPNQPKAGPSKPTFAIGHHSMETAMRLSTGSTGKSTMALLSKQKMMVLRTGKGVVSVKSGHRGMADDVKEPTVIEDRMVMKSRQVQIQDSRKQDSPLMAKPIHAPWVSHVDLVCISVNKSYNVQQL